MFFEILIEHKELKLRQMFLFDKKNTKLALLENHNKLRRKNYPILALELQQSFTEAKLRPN